MIRSVLIANRGEIAARIIRTLKRMGLKSVALYHFEDRAAPYLREADEAHELIGDPPAAAYLDGARILAIAAAAGADAVHPGYGFLAENAGFARAVADAGLSFVGPAPETIALMGDKIRARAFAGEAGVPVAQGIELDAEAADAAAEIGFPLLIKPAAGGGGKGMHIVRDAAELAQSMRLSASAAERYFADGRIYAERYIERPRHIEVQVFGDGKGGAIHLGERECSIQRRFQKIVEEAPAPSLAPDLRDRIRAAAVELAGAARYRNAGTVEFILSPEDEFFFLEMNTRLQVEHPVSEAITGLDFVELQMAIAGGEELPAQSEVSFDGHALEFRICAEAPERDFLPATGRLRLLRVPEGPGLRWDGGAAAGQAITASFDPLLAKLIAHGADRAQALDRGARALAQLVLLGVDTNIDYLARIAGHPAFVSGDLHTGFVVEHADALRRPELDAAGRAALLLAAAAPTRRRANESASPLAAMGEWRN